MGEDLPRSRPAAKAAGTNRYFTGRPCKHGHVAERIASNGECLPCRDRYRRGRRDQINAHLRGYAPLWRARNRDKVRAIKARQMAKPEYRLVQRMRARAYVTLKRGGLSKRTSHSKLFGAPAKEVRAYLEARFKPGMTWDNWGQGADKWHVDHVIPISSFDLAVPGEIERAFHYTNLQPLWQWENLAKSNKVPDGGVLKREPPHQIDEKQFVADQPVHEEGVQGLGQGHGADLVDCHLGDITTFIPLLPFRVRLGE